MRFRKCEFVIHSWRGSFRMSVDDVSRWFDALMRDPKFVIVRGTIGIRIERYDRKRHGDLPLVKIKRGP